MATAVNFSNSTIHPNYVYYVLSTVLSPQFPVAMEVVHVDKFRVTIGVKSVTLSLAPLESYQSLISLDAAVITSRC